MKIKNIEGVSNNLPSIGSFAVDQIIEITESEYSRLRETPVLEAINSDTHVLTRLDDTELTKQESLDLWYAGVIVWTAFDGIITRESLVQEAGKQGAIFSNTLDHSVIPSFGFSPKILTETTNLTPQEVVSFTPDPTKAYRIDAFSLAKDAPLTAAFTQRVYAVSAGGDLGNTVSLERQGPSRLRLRIVKNGGDIQVQARGRSSETWNFETIVCVSEI